MYTILAILLVIVSVLLTLVVLVQNSKGGGLAANFAAGNQTFGVRQTADFLEKATWTLAIAILVCCLTATMLVPRESIENVQSTVVKELGRIQPGESDYNNVSSASRPASTATPLESPTTATPLQ